jgi:hypothetical protein
MKHRFLLFTLSLLLAPTLTLAQAHFAPGVANIRDYAVPAPGLYVAVYNYGYETSDLTDNNGNKVNQVFVGNNPVNVNLEVKLYALSAICNRVHVDFVDNNIICKNK